MPQESDVLSLCPHLPYCTLSLAHFHFSSAVLTTVVSSSAGQESAEQSLKPSRIMILAYLSQGPKHVCCLATLTVRRSTARRCGNCFQDQTCQCGKKISEIPGSSLVRQGKCILHGVLAFGHYKGRPARSQKFQGKTPDQMNPDKHPTIPPTCLSSITKYQDNGNTQNYKGGKPLLYSIFSTQKKKLYLASESVET